MSRRVALLRQLRRWPLIVIHLPLSCGVRHAGAFLLRVLADRRVRHLELEQLLIRRQGETNEQNSKNYATCGSRHSPAHFKLQGSTFVLKHAHAGGCSRQSPAPRTAQRRRKKSPRRPRATPYDVLSLRHVTVRQLGVRRAHITSHQISTSRDHPASVVNLSSSAASLPRSSRVSVFSRSRSACCWMRVPSRQALRPVAVRTASRVRRSSGWAFRRM